MENWEKEFLEEEERKRELEEGIKVIPAVKRVLIEYKRLYSKKKAREMFEILVKQVVDFCVKDKQVKRRVEMKKCEFNRGGICFALACFNFRKCSCRDKDGNIRYASTGKGSLPCARGKEERRYHPLTNKIFCKCDVYFRKVIREQAKYEIDEEIKKYDIEKEVKKDD